MIGALDQDFYPDTIYSTPGKAYLVDMMRKGRALGLNVLRCHIKVCDPDYLAAADEVGMLVWYEVPSWERWTPASLARGKAIFDAMTKRDWNRPSIVIQTLDQRGLGHRHEAGRPAGGPAAMVRGGAARSSSRWAACWSTTVPAARTST